MRPHELDLLVAADDRISHVDVHDLAKVLLRIVLVVEEATVEGSEGRLPPLVVLLSDELLLIRGVALERVLSITSAGREGVCVRVTADVGVERSRRDVLAIRLLGADHLWVRGEG